MQVIRNLFRKISIFTHVFPRRVILFSLVVFLGFLAIFFWRLSSFSSPVILRFNEAQGIMQFGERNEIFGLWLLFVALFTLNAFLAEYFFLRNRFLSYALMTTNALLTAIFSIVGVFILLIN